MQGNFNHNMLISGMQLRWTL